MKKLAYSILLLALTTSLHAQHMYRPSDYEISQAPQWAQMMYSENPNALEVDAAFQAYYKEYPFEKSYHTQYYKRWRRAVDGYLTLEGTVGMPSASDRKRMNDDALEAAQGGSRSGNWNLVGPIVTYNTNGERISQQANIYSLDQAATDANILYCGTEPGEVYKSIDGGDTWANVSMEFIASGGVRSVEIDPSNADVVYVGTSDYIFKTIDGGNTWSNLLFVGGLRPNEILVNPLNTDVVLAACDQGLYRSENGGDDWTAIYSERAFDVKFNTADANTVYLVKHDANLDLCTFWRSEDAGATWEIQMDGWYYSGDPNRNDGGARLAVSDADPYRIYAYLIGEAKANDNGYIGVWRSEDGGSTWTLPNGPAGGPYDDDHMNLAIGTVNWQYHQGFYNCALMASHEDADKILLGGLNLYASDDGGETFYPLAGYVGGDYNIHVDMQDFRAFDGTTWITTDGGIYRSEDFFETDGFTSEMYGIHGSEFWGFGSGWNEDVLIGGLYHNGNPAYYQNYEAGNFLNLGGGEPASGYVNQGENTRVYSSDINGRIMPQNIGDPVQSVGFGIDPNESYWAVESSELEFAPYSHSTAFTGKDNQLWRTDDKGTTFTLVAEFGGNPNNKITYIEPAWDNPDFMLVCQQLVSPSQGSIIWGTTTATNGPDEEMDWEPIAIPELTNSRKLLLQIDPQNHANLWLACASSVDGQRVYKSTDEGTTWTNLTTPILNGHVPRSLVHIGGTDGGVYLATNRSVFYRDNTMSDWEEFGDGLPLFTNTCIARPFYRDDKLRIATYGKGIWETALHTPQSGPVAQIMVDKLEVVQHCDQEVFHYVDHSMLNHEGATWEWTFEGGTPATADTWQADVTYAAPGTYLSTLTVTDGNGNSDTHSLSVEVLPYEAVSILYENFEASFPPAGFEIVNEDEDITWELESEFGAFGESDQCMKIRGFDYWPGGDEDDINVTVNTSEMEDAWLTFDVAYARYAVNYTDSIEVLVSTDCGENLTSLYFRGGEELATAPDFSDGPFIPANNEWRTDSIDFSAYEGIEEVMVVFRSHTGWGQNVYVDNINLGGDPLNVSQANPSQGMVLYPNPISNGQEVFIDTEIQESILVELYNMEGKRVYKKSHTPQGGINIPTLPSGAYLYVLSSSKLIQKGKLIIK